MTTRSGSPTPPSRAASRPADVFLLAMRDLIVKINTESTLEPLVEARDDSAGSLRDAEHADGRPTSAGSSVRRDGDEATDDGSDSGTAGSPGPSLWPDLEVLDPDHPM